MVIQRGRSGLLLRLALDGDLIEGLRIMSSWDDDMILMILRRNE